MRYVSPILCSAAKAALIGSDWLTPANQQQDLVARSRERARGRPPLINMLICSYVLLEK